MQQLSALSPNALSVIWRILVKWLHLEVAEVGICSLYWTDFVSAINEGGLFRMKRFSLLASYLFLVFALFMLFLGDNLIPRKDESFVFTDMIPFIVWAVIFVGHHALSQKYLKNTQNILSFQVFCTVIDLIFLFYFLSLSYFRFKEWMLTLVIALRICSLLLTANYRKKQ